MMNNDDNKQLKTRYTEQQLVASLETIIHEPNFRAEDKLEYIEQILRNHKNQ